jgi:hypothetical protein
LKHFFYILLYLNIYTLLIAHGNAQEFYLNIEAEIPISKSLADSLNTEVSYPDFRSVREAADSLQGRLHKLGFLEARLDALEKANDSVFNASFFFGTQYKYIKIYYDPSAFSKKELSRISKEITDEWFSLSFEETEPALTKLNAIKTENGNAFARIRLSQFQKEEDAVMTARLQLESGAQRLLDSVVVKGYDKFPRSFLKYYAGIKEGRPFNRKKLNRQNEVLNGLGFVNTLKGPEVLFKENKTAVYFYLERRNNNLFDGILGFATDEESNKLEFNGYLNLELNNNLNFGEQLLVNYKADGNEQQNFRARARLPYLFSSPFGLELELKIFKRDSTFVTTDQSVKATYQINPFSLAYIGYKAAESSNLLDEVLAGTSVEDYKSKYFISGVQFVKTQNDALFPVKSEIAISSEIGNRTLKTTNESQTRLSLVAGNIFNLNFNNSIYLQNASSVLFSETFLTNELFRFGGINSIRGFNENSIDAVLFSVLNTEYRYRFSPGFYMHSIIDLAYFENETIDIKQKLYSFGIGLGLLTKAGLLKFNLANGNSENQNFNFSNTKIHLSLSSRF